MPTPDQMLVLLELAQRQVARDWRPGGIAAHEVTVRDSFCHPLVSSLEESKKLTKTLSS